MGRITFNWLLHEIKEPLFLVMVFIPLAPALQVGIRATLPMMQILRRREPSNRKYRGSQKGNDEGGKQELHCKKLTSCTQGRRAKVKREGPVDWHNKDERDDDKKRVLALKTNEESTDANR